MDFEEIDGIREQDEKLKEEHKFGPSRGDPISSTSPMAGIIDGDSAIYNPHVICEHPDVVYDDYEGREFDR